MSAIATLLGVICLFFGLFFSLVGVVGALRLPDTYSRLHATGKVGTLGVFGLVLAVVFLMPASGVKALALALFIIFTGPVSSHAIAAGLRRGEQHRKPEGIRSTQELIAVNVDEEMGEA